MARGGSGAVLPPAVRPGAARDGSLRSISLVRAATASPPACVTMRAGQSRREPQVDREVVCDVARGLDVCASLQGRSGNAFAQPEFIYNTGPADRVLLLIFGGRSEPAASLPCRSGLDCPLEGTEGKLKKTASLMMVWIVVACGRALGAAPIVWVVPSSLHRVYPTDAPGARTKVMIYCARGEYQPFQVAIQAPAGGLTRVNFSVSHLVGPRGAVLSRRNLILYREWYITVRHHSPTYNGPPNLPITKVRTFPDALIPFLDPATGKPPVDAKFRAVPFNLKAGHNAVIWARRLCAPRYAGGPIPGHLYRNQRSGDVRGPDSCPCVGIYFAAQAIPQVQFQRR